MSETVEITCKINGQDEKLPAGTSLIGFLELKTVKPGAVVVEHNGEILPKGEYDGINLADGDTLEIVQVIGGG